MTDRSDLRVLYITSVCDPKHTISASAFWWADALAARCRSVDVIALDTGGRPRPNMRLHSLDRSQRGSAWLVVPRLAALLARLVPKVDVIFCQYSTKFVFAAWPFAVLFRQPVVLWWSHAHVDWRLRLATRMVRAIVTSSTDSFRLATPKKYIIGHGIDVETFSPASTEDESALAPLTERTPLRLVSIGRISPVKDVRTIVKAAGLLKRDGSPPFTLDLVGDTGRSGDDRYLRELKQLVRDLGLEETVRFMGPMPHDQTAALLRHADIFVNALAAGGVGRAWLEAMSVGVPTVLCSPAIDDLLDADARRLLRFRERNAEDLAARLRALIEMDCQSRRTLGRRLRHIVVRDHSLTHLADALHGVLLEVCGTKRMATVAPVGES